MSEKNSASARSRLATIAASAAVATAAILSIASPAALAAPKGIFTPFAQCPITTPGLVLCQYVEITSGELTAGPMTVPIDQTIVFQGGGVSTGGQNPNEFFLVPAANGESVSPTDLNVPGGLRTIIDCPPGRDTHRRSHDQHNNDGGCPRPARESRANNLTLRIEPLASPTDPAIVDLATLIEERGTALTFPARVHLKNTLLGETCYVGSATHPILLHLTVGTTSPPPPNQPITGKKGELISEFENGYEVLKVTEDTLVDNAFPVPPAEGCGHDEHQATRNDNLIDQTLGLESPAGRNTVILSGTHRLAEVSNVIASETFPTKE